MNARLLNVLHDRADHRGLTVADAIDIDLGGVVEETVDEHRALGRGGDRFAHVG